MGYRIAVGIPAFNEEDTIAFVTGQIDHGVQQLYAPDKGVIVLINSESTDRTLQRFEEVRTVTPKLILNSPRGKGHALFRFWQYGRDEAIPYLVTIDGDVRTISPEWVSRLATPLLTDAADFVVPHYARNRFSGNVTHHFVYPVLAAVFGVEIRQPIAGEFGFTSHFYQHLLDQPTCQDTYHYGIDVFATYNALLGRFRIQSVDMDVKIDRSGFHHQEQLFLEVAHSTLFGVKQCWVRGTGMGINDYLPEDADYIGIEQSTDFPYHLTLPDMLDQLQRQFTENDAINWLLGPNVDRIGRMIAARDPSLTTEDWATILAHVLQLVYSPSPVISLPVLCRALLPVFRWRVVSFWLSVIQADPITVETIIRDQARQLRDRLLT